MYAKIQTWCNGSFAKDMNVMFGNKGYWCHDWFGVKKGFMHRIEVLRLAGEVRNTFKDFLSMISITWAAS